MQLLREGRLDTITLNGLEHKVNYAHFRRITDGKISVNGGVTVAYANDVLGDVIARGIHVFKDTESFNKRLGRVIATGRMLKSKGLPRK